VEHGLAHSTSAASVAASQNRTLRRLVRLAALVLVLGTVGFVAFYLVDQHTEPGPTLVQRALEQTEAQVRQDPNNIGLRLKLAAAYQADGRITDATGQYDEVLSASPDNVGALLGKAGILQEAGDLAGASTLYRRVIDIRKGGEMASSDTELAHAYYGVGSIATAQHQFAEAIAALESAVRIDGTDADAWYVLGEAQLGAGVTEQAIAAERNAIAFVPLGWADPYTVLQKAYTAEGKSANASWALAMTDLIAKRVTEAKAQLLALTDGPAAADADIGLAFIAEIEGDTQGALGWYQKALAKDPRNTTAADGVGRMGGATASPAPSAPAQTASPKAS
jgi:tetratricopeptide (TPR) repeat protein